jgi:hypothetical protein
VAVPALTIAQLSARSGAAPSALRYYEELGLIRAEDRRAAGHVGDAGQLHRLRVPVAAPVRPLQPGRRRGAARRGRALAARRRAP